MIVGFGSTAVVALARDLAIGSTAILALAIAGHLALGRRRATARSALWNAGLAALLILPAAAIALPRLRVEIPAAPVAIVDRDREVLPPTVVDPAIERGSMVVARPAPLASPSEPAPAEGWWPGGFEIALGVYALVATLRGIGLLAAMAAIGRLRRRCRPIDEPRWAEALDRWRGRLGIGRRVDLLSTDRVSVPIAAGWLRPTIVVPEGLVGTSDAEAIDAVLLHELGHVRRGDFGWNLVLKIVQILYWPHPMIWAAGRMIAGVREQVCDDLCVHVLGGSGAYRSTLIEVASGLVRRPGPSIGMAMARGPGLGRRLDWIDRTRGASRCLSRWPARLGFGLAMIAAAALLGSVEVSHASARPDDPQGTLKAGITPRAMESAGKAALEVSGTVRRPDGKPLENAKVALAYPWTGKEDTPSFVIQRGELARFDPSFRPARTDAAGRFRLTRRPDPAGRSFAVVVVHPEFFAEVARSAFEADPVIVARPWGRIEGEARIGDRPAAGAGIHYLSDRLGNPDVPSLFDSGQLRADGRGRFVIERVVPGDVRVSGQYTEGAKAPRGLHDVLVEVKPGETSRIRLGGRGRPVVAKVVPPPGFRQDERRPPLLLIESDRPRIPEPSPYDPAKYGPRETWARRWWVTPEGRAYRRGWHVIASPAIGPDGTVRIEDVPPDRYWLTLKLQPDPYSAKGPGPAPNATLTRTFTIPEIPGGRSDEPFDLGVLEPKVEKPADSNKYSVGPVESQLLKPLPD